MTGALRIWRGITDCWNSRKNGTDAQEVRESKEES